MKKGTLAGAFFVALGIAGASQAALLTFEVDPARSTLALGQIGIAGEEAFAQTGGGGASYTGTFEVDIAGDMITFLGGSQTIVANNSATPLLPGGSPANYGIFNLTGDTAALREFQFTFENFDPATPYEIAPDGTIVDEFDEPVRLAVPASWTRYVDLIDAPPDSDFRNTLLDNFGFPPRYPAARVIRDGDLITLEIPVALTISWAEFGANDSQFELIGTIVATNGVPEPGAVGVLVLGGGMLTVRRRRA